MEASEEVAAHIVKGKRTKRLRVDQSSIPFGLTTDSSSGDGGTNWSPATSIDEFQDSTEEEDMANCLILLAKGHSRDFPEQQQQHHQDHDSRGGACTTKFNSRKFLETANSTGPGKVGYYVYECKTCTRTFPSFQALGGHRASHKKSKAIHHDEKKQNLSVSSDEEDGHFYKNVSSLSLQLSDNNTNRGTYSNQNKGKIHECSTCGAVFTSGQALGGHMRRHRGSTLVSATTTLSLTPIIIESEEPERARNVLSLDLDLNLPAPEDDKFAFASKQQQKQQQQKQQNTSLVFSSPALVDCHY